MNESHEHDELLLRQIAEAIDLQQLESDDAAVERALDDAAREISPSDSAPNDSALSEARVRHILNQTHELESGMSATSRPTVSLSRPEVHRGAGSRGAAQQNESPYVSLTIGGVLLLAVALLAGSAFFGAGGEQPEQQPAAVADATDEQDALSQLRNTSYEPGDHVMVARQRGKTVTPEVGVGEAIATRPGERRRVALPDGSIAYINESTRLTVTRDRRLELAFGEVYVEVARAADRRSGQPRTFIVATPDREVTALGTKFSIARADDATRVFVTQGKVAVDGVQQALVAGQQLLLEGEGAAEKAQATVAQRASHLLAWTRDLLAAAESPLVPGSEHAGGALIAVDPSGQEAKLSLRKYHVDVHIEDGFARTTIDQTYFNHQTWRMEGTFYFPLPPDASLSRLAMYVGPKLMEGGMADREHARNVFEQIVYRQRDPALLEWVDGSTFKMRVFPLEGRQEKRIVISYTQKLPGAYGETRYRFPAGHNLEGVRDFSANVRIKNGVPLHWHSPSHDLQAAEDGDDLVLTGEEHHVNIDKDLVITLQRGSSDDSSAPVSYQSAVLDGQRYFAVRLRPALPTTAVRERRNWVLLFENSGDRDPLLARAQIDVLQSLLENAEHDDTFSIVTASTRSGLFSERPLPCTEENIARAVDFLESVHLVGALDLGQALQACEPLVKAGDNSHLVHVGSGVPVIGRREQKAVLDLLPQGAKYVGVGVGKRWNRMLMKEAARRTGGYFTQINPDEPVSWRAFELLSALNAPRLLDVRVTADEDWRFHTLADAVADGEEILAVARAPENVPVPQHVQVVGMMDGERYVVELPVDVVREGAGHLPRTWARQEIDRLVAEGAEANKQKIIELSKATYVMSPFTSLLVLESEEMYEQFHVDRGRKDHWAMYPAPEEIEVVYEPLGPAPPPKDDSVEEGTNDDRATAERVLQSINFRIPPRMLYWPQQYDPGYRVLTAWQLLTGVHANPQLSLLGQSTSERLDGLSEVKILEEFREGQAIAGNYGGYLLGDRFLSLGLDLSQVTTQRTNLGPGYFTNDFAYKDLFRRLPNAGNKRLSSPWPTYTIANSMAWRSMELSFEDGYWPGISWGKNGNFSRFDDSRELLKFNLPSPRSFPSSRPMSVDFIAPQGQVITFDELSFAGAGGGSGGGGPGLPRGARGDWRWGWHGGVTDLMAIDDIVWSDLQTSSEKISSAVRGGQNGDQNAPLDAAKYGKRLTTNAVGWLLDSLQRGTAYANYQRPSFTGNYHVFTDLLAYAPGMNSTSSDVSAALEAEGKSATSPRTGAIDDGARRLIEQARRPQWESIRIEAAGDFSSDVTIRHDYAGKFVIDRRVNGLQEEIVCDGETLWHLYRELGVGARRTMCRAYRRAYGGVAPWSVAAVEDLALGADVRLVNENTIAIVPLPPQTEAQRTASQEESTKREDAAPHKLVLHLVFDKASGRLAERRLFDATARKTLLRTKYSPGGKLTVYDAEDKLLAERTLRRQKAAAPSLAPQLEELVVLPLPYRSAQHLRQSMGEQAQQPVREWSETYALSMLMTHLQDPHGMRQLIGERFFDRGDRRIGFYTLLLSTGFSWTSGEAYTFASGKPIRFDPLADHPDEPLAKYAAELLHWHQKGRPHEGAAIDGPSQSFVVQLAEFRRLWYEWNSGRATSQSDDHRRQTEEQTQRYLAACPHPEWGWALLSTELNYGGSRTYQGVADVLRRFRDVPEMAYHSRYERARMLRYAGQNQQSAKEFREAYETAFEAGLLPPIDGDFRAALQAVSNASSAWPDFVRKSSGRLLERKQPTAVVYLAMQCQQVGDTALAEELLAAALAQLERPRENLGVYLWAVRYFWQSGQMPRADALVASMLEDDKLAGVPALWRLSAWIAEQDGKLAAALSRKERALDIEFDNLPEMINLQVVRQQYGELFAQYHRLAEAIATLESEPPAGFVERVIISADRWRYLDDDDTQAAQAAANVLAALNRPELAWDYLTTPLAQKPNEAAPWLSMAQNLRQSGEFPLAVKSYALAFEAEPTNAQILWDEAQLLLQTGRREDARRLFAQLAQGDWQPRFNNIKRQAQRYLGGEKP